MASFLLWRFDGRCQHVEWQGRPGEVTLRWEAPQAWAPPAVLCASRRSLGPRRILAYGELSVQVLDGDRLGREAVWQRKSGWCRPYAPVTGEFGESSNQLLLASATDGVTLLDLRVAPPGPMADLGSVISERNDSLPFNALKKAAFSNSRFEIIVLLNDRFVLWDTRYVGSKEDPKCLNVHLLDAHLRAGGTQLSDVPQTFQLAPSPLVCGGSNADGGNTRWSIASKTSLLAGGRGCDGVTPLWLVTEHGDIWRTTYEWLKGVDTDTVSTAEKASCHDAAPTNRPLLVGRQPLGVHVVSCAIPPHDPGIFVTGSNRGDLSFWTFHAESEPQFSPCSTASPSAFGGETVHHARPQVHVSIKAATSSVWSLDFVSGYLVSAGDAAVKIWHDALTSLTVVNEDPQGRTFGSGILHALVLDW